MSLSSFPALTGYYKLLFLYIEPASTLYPAFWTLVTPGAKSFHDDLIPLAAASAPLDPRTTMAIMQLTNTYMVLSLLSSLVFRAIRDALPGNPVAQERIVGRMLIALAIADVSHVVITFLSLPSEIQFQPSVWNSMTHGNITFTALLFVSRMAWFSGIGRRSYYFGKAKTT